MPHVLLQVHILGVGLAVHEKLVHPEMRPLHKKLVDQFHMMRTGLHHVSVVGFLKGYFKWAVLALYDENRFFLFFFTSTPK